jgi:hypothetical protein
MSGITSRLKQLKHLKFFPELYILTKLNIMLIENKNNSFIQKEF